MLARDRIAVVQVFPLHTIVFFGIIVMVWLKPRPRLRRRSVELWIQKSVRSSGLCIRIKSNIHSQLLFLRN